MRVISRNNVSYVKDSSEPPRFRMAKTPPALERLFANQLVVEYDFYMANFFFPFREGPLSFRPGEEGGF